MLLDNTTEIVSHFAGLFHIQTEEARLKDAYAAFRAAREEAAALRELDTVGVKHSATFALEGFTPGFSYIAPFFPVAGIATLFGAPVPFFAGSLIPASVGVIASVAAGGLASAPPPVPFGTASPASSIVVVNYQTNTLDDLDTFGKGDISVKELSAKDTADITKAEKIIEALTPFDPQTLDISTGDAVQIAQDIYQQIQTATEAPIADIAQYIANGTTAEAPVIIDGQIADELPKFDDLLPAFLQEDDDDNTADDTTIDSEGKGTVDENGNPSTEQAELIAEATAFADSLKEDTSAPDAKTEADAPADDTPPDSAGEEVTFVKSDTPDPVKETPNPYAIDEGQTIVTGANQAVNEVALSSNWLDAPLIAVMQDAIEVDAISQINVIVDHDLIEGETPVSTDTATSTSLNAARMEETANPFDAVRGEDGFPTSWYVARIEGDLVSVNWIEQHNYTMDGDSVQVEVSGINSSIITGTNTSINVSQLTEIGFGYDMIIVGGNMVDMSLISQSNIIIDNDIIDLGDAPADVVSASDNLALNIASITQQGIDTHVGLDDTLRDAGEALADAQASALPFEVNTIDMFDDMVSVRVLYIEGDYVTITSVDQRNVIGDSDHVKTALDDFLDAQDTDISITTGSNAALNLASVARFGVDSQIQVGGDFYSDAMLYQAELIDASADPTGVGISSLANEAVAFLAEGLIDSDASTADDALLIDQALQAGGASTGDVLTTVLA